MSNNIKALAKSLDYYRNQLMVCDRDQVGAVTEKLMEVQAEYDAERVRAYKYLCSLA